MTREELKEHCKRQVQQFERVEKIMPVTPNDWKRYEEHKLILELLEQEPRKGHWIETAEEYYKAINEKGGGVNENTDFFTDDIACSECLAKFSVIDNEAERFDFCPCCGSDNR